MKINQCILATALLCVHSLAIANVELTLPSSSELILINGKEADSNKALSLDNGENQIALRYIGRYQQQGSQTQFSSDVIVVTFSAADKQLKMDFPRIRSNSAADAFNRNPQITIKDSSGTIMAFKQGLLIKEGMQLGRDYEAEIRIYNSSHQVAGVSSLALAAPIILASPPIYTQAVKALPAEVTSDSNAKSDQINVGQMLDFWYEQAHEATKKAFKLKINAK
ncbi:DUF2057 domain-containing protein [Shewanella gelidimarina]|uniref:DUF2057 domain-containing protein n=1 Tax=Shewanella gelidimarina TaxID=56813 RepID=UPI00200BBFC4|nr:DUF2057 domain-containing protein [Shewanella gelidimarina]MCL1058629.1 DUF2057 domain-containing protein [Shewanella gelidimarina]